ncbi:carbohydrate ABC transporter permease [Parasedimentitalea psychrophila]|uniref:Carbohydrate ABC transporter permease n=1 Tax=Parasedimentitalea psychrophila TaxID=2997337 RepID=A0A9Y2P0N2_9RHOB|nr:carbohydrate ABC transporter permease [Parasedimentitalea psychrophila]WIY24766.1 carbohydrate ABC transporter permease [Parasedimentitalea psychrophila]
MIVQPVTLNSRLLMGARWAVLFIAVVVLNFPILATVLTSFKSTADINAYPPKWLFTPTLDHYYEVLFTGNTNFVSYIWNSVVIASGGTLLAIVLTFPAAYAIARYKTGAAWLLPIVSNLRALPLIIFAIPFYFMYQSVGLLDTKLGLALIACIINIPLALLMLVGFMQDIPAELDEAGRLDGASTLQVLYHIIWPASRPILFAVAILSFIYSWNEFLFGLILATKSAVPVTVGATFFVTSYGVKWGATAAAMMLGVFPPMLLGFFAYPYIGKSMLRGAVKG